MPASRDPWLDNAKATLIVLVVVGHLWELVPPSRIQGDVYDFLYLWHMPAFVFLAGHLSRGFGYERRRLWDLVTTLATPYVVFEASLALFRIHVGGEDLQYVFADPHFPLWFLPALIAWRLLTPLFRPMRGGVVVAVGISLVAGLIDHETSRLLDLARILGFLPFFVLGLKTTPAHLAWLRGRFPAALGVVAFAGIAVLAATSDRWIDSGFLYFRAYELTGEDGGHSVSLRLLVLTVGAVGTMAFLALVPSWDGWFTRVGAATIVVYLAHGFVVKALVYAGIGDALPSSGTADAVASVASATLLGVAIALALASAPVRRLLDPVVDPFHVAQRRVDDAVDLALLSLDDGEVSTAGAGGGR
ncbi:acyltransferase family protein [Nocardioides caeni]|uniref:Acyltransferase n=1 Tax=Nocardioides caeni TaxID=574700 RepID=A0A4S8NLI5_9ACTN|nr:acyltransferase family protein [Nocardioides caeni]THV17857.1 acyltransferase [Nocardioides caeni]